MNVGAIESYLISNNQQQQGANPIGTPGGIDEALAGKSLDEQVDIINKFKNIVDNTNTNPQFEDAGSLQRTL